MWRFFAKIVKGLKDLNSFLSKSSIIVVLHSCKYASLMYQTAASSNSMETSLENVGTFEFK